MTRCLRLTLALLLACAAQASAQVLDPAREGLAGWEEQRFHGRTRYRIVTLDGEPVLEAHARAGASGLVRPVAVDLAATPLLRWRWRVERLPRGAAEHSRAGDDFAARLYVVFRTGPFPWQRYALDYVWTRATPPGTRWPNPYTGHTVMWSVAQGEAGLGRWQTHERDVAADLRRAFGREVRRIEAVALMTDADDTGSEALAYYGAIAFLPAAAAAAPVPPHQEVSRP
ncbi:DUF3047 domain-containing protein [Inmirania thermothiophila]|uniref:DUF3047 family protein n=1 Tax=Inmirania thermothiophila TaxID=1750597 RepID=A0A3N1Y7Z4_9GAMM|nr:DUF3047 domain-containing protein [Inmirania thermothiophila]ROR34628.1 DUF3047 family protein [Inmirania thermothiophila]